MQEKVSVGFTVIEQRGWGLHNMAHDIHDDWTLQYFYFTGAWLLVFFWHSWYFSATLEV